MVISSEIVCVFILSSQIGIFKKSEVLDFLRECIY